MIAIDCCTRSERFFEHDGRGIEGVGGRQYM